MAHDAFISYSSKDKPIADGVCANLEAGGIRCWIAPRDISSGEDWPTAIANAISQSFVMVLVFSAHSNASDEVSRELYLAADSKVIIIPFRIDDVKPEPGKQYYLGRTHWLDAMNPPTQKQINLLVERVKSILPKAGTSSFATAMEGLSSDKTFSAPKASEIPVRKKRAEFKLPTIPRRAVITIGLIVLGLGLLAVFFKPLSAQLFSAPTSTFVPTTTPTVAPSLTPSPTSTLAATPDMRILNPANQHQYLYVAQAKTWTGAERYCEQQSGHLVTIKDAEENQFVHNLTGGQTWLGATHNVKKGIWEWVTGEPLTYINWDAGTFGNHIYAQLHQNLKWTGELDGNETHFACEWETASP